MGERRNDTKEWGDQRVCNLYDCYSEENKDHEHPAKSDQHREHSEKAIVAGPAPMYTVWELDEIMLLLE